MEERRTAIVLAGGQGRRMGTKLQKQYLEVQGRPVLAWALLAFERSAYIDDILLVAGEGQEEYCRREIVKRYGIGKLRRIVPGGAERYDSVWHALKTLEPTGYVFIHDGARPFVTEEIIARAYADVKAYGACAVGVPVKDTIKNVTADGMSAGTPDRRTLWTVQTPQTFRTDLIKDAYAQMMRRQPEGVTDDAMVVERICGKPVKMTMGSYRNIKITTPEDLLVADAFARDILGKKY